MVLLLDSGRRAADSFSGARMVNEKLSMVSKGAMSGSVKVGWVAIIYPRGGGTARGR